jgi:hypothetical protein
MSACGDVQLPYFSTLSCNSISQVSLVVIRSHAVRRGRSCGRYTASK